MHFSSFIDLPSEGSTITSGDVRIDWIPTVMQMITALFQEQGLVDLPSELCQDLVQSVAALVNTILASAWRDAEANNSEGTHWRTTTLCSIFRVGTLSQ